MVRSYIGTAAYRPIPEEVLAATAEPWLGPIGQPALYRQMVQANPRQTEEVEGSYGKITEEVLVLWGEKDAWIPVERGHELTERFPNARLHTIAESGHLVIEEKPEELLSHIRPFLREVCSR
jgi:pimeloyl-ACP methyl ester carboxylesterase